MKTLFEILNKLKLIHDFLMGPAEASRIADCFSHDEQTSTAGVREKKKKEDTSLRNFFNFLPHTNLKKPISCPVRLDVIAHNSMTLKVKDF